MELFADYENPESDAGEWVEFKRGTDPKGKDTVSVLIRRIPAAEARLIERRHGGRKQPLFMKKGGGAVMEVDSDKSAAEISEKACYALIDTRNMEVRASDTGAAAFYSDALGQPVKVGDLVCLDSKWTKAVKERIFGAAPAFARRIVSLAVQLDQLVQASLAEEETGKDES